MDVLFQGLDVAANDFDKQAPEIRAMLKQRGLDPEQPSP
jgi:hypothetical protein